MNVKITCFLWNLMSFFKYVRHWLSPYTYWFISLRRTGYHFLTDTFVIIISHHKLNSRVNNAIYNDLNDTTICILCAGWCVPSSIPRYEQFGKRAFLNCLSYGSSGIVPWSNFLYSGTHTIRKSLVGPKNVGKATLQNFKVNCIW